MAKTKQALSVNETDNTIVDNVATMPVDPTAVDTMPVVSETDAPIVDSVDSVANQLPSEYVATMPAMPVVTIPTPIVKDRYTIAGLSYTTKKTWQVELDEDGVELSRESFIKLMCDGSAIATLYNELDMPHAVLRNMTEEISYCTRILTDIATKDSVYTALMQAKISTNAVTGLYSALLNHLAGFNFVDRESALAFIKRGYAYLLEEIKQETYRELGIYPVTESPKTANKRMSSGSTSSSKPRQVKADHVYLPDELDENGNPYYWVAQSPAWYVSKLRDGKKPFSQWVAESASNKMALAYVEGVKQWVANNNSIPLDPDNTTPSELVGYAKADYATVTRK